MPKYGSLDRLPLEIKRHIFSYLHQRSSWISFSQENGTLIHGECHCLWLCQPLLYEQTTANWMQQSELVFCHALDLKRFLQADVSGTKGRFPLHNLYETDIRRIRIRLLDSEAVSMYLVKEPDTAPRCEVDKMWHENYETWRQAFRELPTSVQKIVFDFDNRRMTETKWAFDRSKCAKRPRSDNTEDYYNFRQGVTPDVGRLAAYLCLLTYLRLEGRVIVELDNYLYCWEPGFYTHCPQDLQLKLGIEPKGRTDFV